jgi:hypothetical protein
MKHFAIPILLLFAIAGCARSGTEQDFTTEKITEYWTTGQTLPSSVTRSHPLPLQPVQNDKGFNVLIDLAHECSFHSLWTVPEQLNSLGYRAVGSHATLSSVLDPRGESRIRVLWDTINKVYPFAWWPNARYHVVITNQYSSESQEYTDEEITALTGFVSRGGGLIVQTNSRRWQEGTDGSARGSLGALVDALGGNVTDETLRLEYGKGRVIITGDPKELRFPSKATEDQKDSVSTVLDGYLGWLTERQRPLRDEPRLPEAMWGGGGIYPELEDHFSDIVFYYAGNQKPDLLKVVKEDVPVAQAFIQERLPSVPTAEPMYLILAAGGGGGWAVNIYRPKENGIISLDGFGILSIFGHELAHTMHGPANDGGGIAGIAPIPGRGEAHAGWFQGKVNALFKPELRDRPNRDCNHLFDYDPKGNAMDLAICYENEAMHEKWGYGKDWTKTWYIWQKLDDRYGPDWYPRWKYVQHTRWKDDPEHRLTWDEMIEDMSIAVGEDLFPFFVKLGTTLEKGRLEKIEFGGEVLVLPPAPIEVTPAGPVNLHPLSSPDKPGTGD